MNHIEVKNLSFRYIRAGDLLRKLSFNVEQGSFLAIAGPNGVGKTTLLNLMAGRLKPHSGSILIESRRVRSYSAAALAQKIAVVRQQFVPIFGFSVAESVMMARTPYFSQTGFERAEDKEIVQQALEATDCARFGNRPLDQLSGGERQRVFIARALAQDTPILLLDEPTNQLDIRHQVNIYDLLKTLQSEKGKTIAAVTHDINLAGQYCDNALLLSPGATYTHGRPNEVFTPDNIESAFNLRPLTLHANNRTFFIPQSQLPPEPLAPT